MSEDKDKEEYEDELVTSHSDENPELQQGRNRAGEPLAAYCDDGSPSDALNYKDRDRKPFRYVLQPGETVVYEDTYIPPEE
jgi:hypothetical protein